MIRQKLKTALKKIENSNNPFIIKLIGKNFYKLLKFGKKIALMPQNFYEIWGAKFLAKYCFFLYWPIYKFCKIFDIRFVANIVPGVGHVVLEFDNFFHRLAAKEIDSSKKYVVLVKSAELYRDFLSIYKNRFFFAASNTFLYDLFLPLLMRYRNLLVDVGVSRMKWFFPEKREKIPLSKGENFVFQCSVEEGILQSQRYYSRRLQTPSLCPLSQDLPSSVPLLEELGIKGKKLCLIHLKTNTINATAAVTDPETYVPTLHFLRNLGYSFVFVGREKMPCRFHEFDMVNYAESKSASFRNDILLFKASDLAIIAGSGISYLADCFNKPLLYLNYWHLASCPFNFQSVYVPTLIKERGEGLLKFSEQFQVYLNTVELDEKLPSDYIAQNASSEEILKASQELIQLLKTPIPYSSLQKKFKGIDQNKGWLSVSLSRPSQFFLEKYSHLF